VSVDLRQVLWNARSADPASIPDIIATAARGIGATDVVVYLVDFAQETLEPLPNRFAHAELPLSEDVATTMAGRAFLRQSAVTAERTDEVRVWVPVLEGSDRTGVLALTLSEANAATLADCEDLGLLVGYLIATHARSTDMYNLHRRRRALSVAAGMQWDRLPPLVLGTDQIAIAGLLEPAYEVAGDCFDYAINGPTLDLAVMDAVGHGIAAALVAELTLGCYRHDRREGKALISMHASIDSTLESHYERNAFSTGQLARVEVETGVLTWTNAGHPRPLLVRGGRVVTELACEPTPPWGLGSLVGASSGHSTVTEATEALEPGDSVVFYTDGVIEAHSPGGELFGLDRLVDLIDQNASEGLSPEETVRRVVRSVLAHQDAALADDATLVIVRWSGPRVNAPSGS